MTGAALPVDAEWLLYEGADARTLPVSERISVDDERWRLLTEFVELEAGIRVFLSSAEVYQPVTITPRQSDDGTWIAANIAAQGTVDLMLSDGPSASIDSRNSVLFRPSDRTATYRPAPGRTLKLAGYMIRDDRIARIFGGQVPREIQALIDQGFDASIILSTPAGRVLRQLARSLFAPNLNGPLRAIFMEGVVLQLFALQAAGYDLRPSARQDDLTADQRRSIHAARERLLSDMRDPPTLGALAAAAGMTEKELNRGFRTLFGTTVFETLRDARLDHARLALQAEAVPIKTIAYRVGYNHVTNFITAFTRRFGAPPRRYLKRSPGALEDGG
ncbi:AraC family transcriptional regulator [Microbaculum marinum]|uniref:AraC family transcriptional regulator n=1 Tax=Microbaculum marinum TaxID=1764581 RepID=A0AAW9RWY9_9HYPH